jgi:hypothetical protein
MSYKDPDKQREGDRYGQARWNRKTQNSWPNYITKKKMIFEAKNKPCAICGQSFPVAAMDLHHVDPSTKAFNIGRGIKLSGRKRLQEEIEKCVALCAVCHRLLHAGLVELVAEKEIASARLELAHLAATDFK